MTRLAAQVLGLVALIPAAANPSLLVTGEALLLPLCNGGTISIPGDNPVPGSTNTACCNKGCHSDDRRKRAKGGATLPGEGEDA